MANATDRYDAIPFIDMNKEIKKNSGNQLKTEFDNAYDAGFDAGLQGGNNFNSHYKWFRTTESLKEWERGKRNAEQKK